MSPSQPAPAWSVADLRLPKALENDSRASTLHAALKRDARELWDAGSIQVPVAPWTPEVATALRNAEREGHVVRGLEQIERTLERQARGLSIADARSGAERGSRVSRLLLVSQDGTERFYRQVERLVMAQGPRLLPIRVKAGSSELAAAVVQGSGVVRASLIVHKDSVTRVLLALYP